MPKGGINGWISGSVRSLSVVVRKPQRQQQDQHLLRGLFGQIKSRCDEASIEQLDATRLVDLLIECSLHFVLTPLLAVAGTAAAVDRGHQRLPLPSVCLCVSPNEATHSFLLLWWTKRTAATADRTWKKHTSLLQHRRRNKQTTEQ